MWNIYELHHLRKTFIFNDVLTTAAWKGLIQAVLVSLNVSLTLWTGLQIPANPPEGGAGGS